MMSVGRVFGSRDTHPFGEPRTFYFQFTYLMHNLPTMVRFAITLMLGALLAIHAIVGPSAYATANAKFASRLTSDQSSTAVALEEKLFWVDMASDSGEDGSRSLPASVCIDHCQLLRPREQLIPFESASGSMTRITENGFSISTAITVPPPKAIVSL